jgi:hypothetical protein
MYLAMTITCDMMTLKGRWNFWAILTTIVLKYSLCAPHFSLSIWKPRVEEYPNKPNLVGEFIFKVNFVQFLNS